MAFSIKDIKPNHPVISKYISSYYFVRSEDGQLDEVFTYCPHYRTTLNIYFDAEVTLKPHIKEVSFKPRQEVLTVLTNHIVKGPRQSHLKGKVNCIVVVFEALGINFFTDGYCPFEKEESILFFNDYWDDFNKMAQSLKNISRTGCVEHLDSYFISHYKPIKEIRLLALIDYIIAQKGNPTVSELSEISNLHRRTLLRLFRLHLNCSISEFKRVVKFRKAIEPYKQNSTKLNLTDIAHIGEYYDQSDFIHQIKLMSGKKPKQLFNKMECFGKLGVYWKFPSDNG